MCQCDGIIPPVSNVFSHVLVFKKIIQGRMRQLTQEMTLNSRKL